MNFTQFSLNFKISINWLENRDADFKVEMRVGCKSVRAMSIKMVVETVTHVAGSRESVESGKG